MSDEIDLEANNLCTTEDAFDKFQSVSMYGEDEYITLSDIVPSSQNNHDITEIFSDSLGNHSTPEEIVQEERGPETLLTTPLPEENTENPPQNFQKKLRRKRDRNEKKRDIQSNISDESNFISSKLLDHSPSIMDREPSKNEQKNKVNTSEDLKSTAEYTQITSINKFEVQHKPTKRRGRPPKPRNCVNENVLLNETEGESNVSKRFSRRKKKKSIDSTTYESMRNNEVSTNMTEQDLDSQQQSIDKKGTTSPLKETNISEHIQINKNMNDSKDNISDDDIEDLPLVALCTKVTQIKEFADTVDNLQLSTEMVENKISNNITINNEKQIETETNNVSKNGHKKRGRPKKCQKGAIDTCTNMNDKNLNHNQKNNEEDDINLSKLKDSTILDDTQIAMIRENNKEVTTPIQNLEEEIEKNIISKRNLKMSIMSGYENKIDNVVSNEGGNDISDEKPISSDSQLGESSRPVRRKTKTYLHYDEGSDEDPFANVELSDDEPQRRKRGGRFYSDDEYIPDGAKSRNRYSEFTDTDTNIEEVLDDVRKPKKKKYRKSNLASQKTPKKVSKQNLEDTSGLNDHIDVELNLETSVIKIDDDKKSEQNKSWGATNEFENFLAKIVQGTDIKIKKANSINSTKTPLQIPTIDPTEEKKRIEISSQTDNVKTRSISVQTNTLYEIPMKNQVALTAEQSQKAIEFLSGIVKTTSELGQLMTEKSEDFIVKKINNSYVTDTFKMDYCVKKSFLLFKLAKHNLQQMEKDLSKQYEDFLNENNLIQHREEQKVISSTSKYSDSDCEIVEEPVKKQAKEKIPFNPKTVFLNKELSIKIAKKPTDTPKAKEKINIKGRHTVWINDSVMVKKVKPTQSFLAQDSRNKKPPDTFITIKMVSDFFKMYERQKAVSLCAPYIDNTFYQGETNYICNYFFKINNPMERYDAPSTEIVTHNEIGSNEINNIVLVSDLNRPCPDSLLSICVKVVQRLMKFGSTLNCKTHYKDNEFLINVTQQFDNNSDISLKDLNTNYNKIHIIKQKRKICSIPTLKSLCYKRICQLIYVPNFSENETEKVTANFTEKSDNTTCENNDILYCPKKSYCNIVKVKSLLSMCVMVLQNHFHSLKKNEKVKTVHKVDTLRHLSLKRIKKIFYHELKIAVHKSVQDRNEINPVKCLSLLCIELISDKITKSGTNYYYAPSGMLQNNENKTPHEIFLKSLSLEKVISLMNSGIKNNSILNFTIDNVNTVSEDIFLENSEYSNDEIASLNNEHYYSDNDLDTNYQDNVDEETNWVAQVEMQELRSCSDLARDNCVISKENIIDDSLVNIKIESLDNFAGNTIYASTVKSEPVDEHENLENFSSIDIITKQEETFATSNKMMTAVANNDEEEIFSQSAHRIRRQYEPDSDDDVDNFSDIMNLLIPQSEETAKDRLMASSSDEGTNKKTSNKKKTERRKPKAKKNKCQMEPTKEKATEKIEILTKKMKEKIRIEEKKRNCSDSEVDDVDLNLKKKNDDKVTNKSSSDLLNNLQEKEIQCNDVDSTEQIIESQGDEKNKDELTPLFSADEPIELLQCTPILSENYGDEIENHVKSDNKASNNTHTNEVTYTDRYGWSCYPIDAKDSKIYQYAHILLDKLPESFVETYYKYQSISAKNYIDSEIDKLTNLQSLHRSQKKGNIRKVKNISAYKSKSHNENVNDHSENEITSEQCQELLLSEDEGNTVNHNFVDYVPEQNSENNFAKNLLMNNDSDGEVKEVKIKEKPKEEIRAKSRSGRLIKPTRHGEAEEIKPKTKNLMLTADKVMDKDLKLLHAPIQIEFKQEPIDAKDIDRKYNTRNSNKKPPKSNVVKIKITDDDASSSEEEKQWFTTKEKLLKRLGKKLDTPSVDDAKRAKIISEFIEKRNDGNGIETTRKRARPRGKSKKKLLERRKQMKILSMELFGDESHTSKKYQSQAYSKGRRNIRKVLDKKSLARSTVLANMDEFERKRRLVQREAQLREVLGCEEGVNVVVINDELCLEYDFENKLPLVTVHSFFTKVMKAHQYEGVKFMWDACFESVSATARGGGGCILAHCMGLGKTLQVLALLHTVLTHPQLNMRRVLVCCPLSTVLNWVDEINKWIGPVTNKIKVFELSKLKKTYERAYQLEDWYNGGGIFIIGYELFRSLTTLDPIMDCIRPTIVNKIRTALLDPGPDIVICDEGHLLKNDSSVLAVAMGRVKTKRRIMLTGTPMQNNLREYYCMVNFVKPNLLGTYSEYSNRFENPIMNGQHRDSREEDIKLMKARTHILHKVLEGCLQRQEASVLYPYLPKKHEYTVFISQSKCQWDLYKHYLKNYAKGTKQSVLKDFHILQKIWTHPQVLHSFLTRARGDEKEVKIKAEKIEDDLAREDLIASEDIKPSATETWWLPHVADSNSLDSLESSNKFLVIFHLLDECIALDDKVLIFSTSLYTMDSLEYFLRRIKQWSLGKEYYRLDGSVPAEVRQKWCREFNAPNNTTTKLFLISTRAGSLGLNMTAANRVIILDTSWNPAHDIQSIFRVYRFGQKKDCYIYRLVAMGTMEQKMYERSVTKQAVACRVVDEQQIDRHYNMAELSELYRLDEDGYSVAAGLAPGVRDGVLLRVARTLGTTEGPGEVNARLHAVHEHDSLLRGSEETGLPEHERNAAWMQFQQEHSSTHNNIQNIEIKIPSIQSNSNDQRDIEIKDEPTDKPKRNNLRSKKGKKNSNDENDVPVLPSTSGRTDPNLGPDLEEETVRKIMSILIKYKFHEAKGPIEIPVLITKVRNVVANIDESGLDNVDPLIASIAKVLINSEKPTVNDTKIVDLNGFFNTDIDVKPSIDITVSCNETAGADDLLRDCELERKRKNQKADSDEEYMPEAGPSRAGRKKKKIKLLDRNINKKSNETCILDNAHTNLILPNTVSYGVQNTIYMQAAQSLPNNESSRNMSSERENINNKQTNMSIDKNNTEEISIILSDDESDRETIRKENTKLNKEKFKPVPLHKSLLSNKNFIKIVAHTYLTGNPKLDEDAAMLAAQYSTFKALKEVEMTGKDIDSGPIYDIATKVIGMPLLEKIQSIHGNKLDDVIDINKETSLSVTSILTPNETTTNSQIGKTEVTIQQHSNVNKNTPSTSKKPEAMGMPLLENIQSIYGNKQDGVFDIDEETSLSVTSILTSNETTTSSEIDKTEVTIQQYRKVKKSTPSSSEKAEKTNLKKNKKSSLTVSPVPTEVVPVGMFIGPASIQPSEPPPHEECILPDDDDIIFTDSIPATTTPLNINKVNSQIAIKNIPSVSKQPVAMSSPKRTIELIKKTPGPFDSGVLLKSNKKKKIVWTPKSTTTQSTKHIVIVNKPTLENMLLKTTPSSNQSSEKINETICLDSDEEETIIPIKKPKPKAFKSTTKLPSSLISKENNNKTISNAKPVNKITPQTLLNTVHNETRQTSDATSVVKKKEASSKQEQIIRISEGGEIELLKRTEIVATQPNTVIFKAEKNKPAILKTPNINITKPKPADVQNLNVSGDENPSSVFQNVIHIHADKYEEVNETIVVDEPEKKTPMIIKDGTKSLKIKFNKLPSTETKKSLVTNVSGKNKITLKFPSNVASTSRKREKVIDLTETILADKKVLIVKKKDWDKVSGSSKDIIINKVGALYKTATTASTSVDITKKANATFTKSSASALKATPGGSVKRLPSTTSAQETTAIKKQDSKKRMMLQDFDIEDFDDIIELE